VATPPAGANSLSRAAAQSHTAPHHQPRHHFHARSCLDSYISTGCFCASTRRAAHAPACEYAAVIRDTLNFVTISTVDFDRTSSFV
jgi:hypothetical protein